MKNVEMKSSIEDTSSIIGDSNQKHENKYYVNIDGEDIEVNVKTDSEYSCLLNCLEGYYMFGNEPDEESENA